MSAKTEILLNEEIKQSNIETKVYDQFVQFYEYGETDETETLAENESRSGKKPFLTAGLAVLGGLFLLAGLGGGFFYLSEKMFQTETVNQFGVKNSPKSENSADGFGEGKSAENGLEAEKMAKAKVNEVKNFSETLVKKENPDSTETKTVKPFEQSDKTSSPVQMTKESTKTSESPKTTDPSLKTTNSSKTFVPKDTKRDFWTSSSSDKTVQNSQASNQNQNDSTKRSSSENFRDLPKNRQEMVVKKIKLSNPEQRSNIRERLQRQRRKN